MLKRVKVQGAGCNTRSLIHEVEKIIADRKKNSLPPFYKIWVVFDRDSFPADDFDNAICGSPRKLDNLNRCKMACKLTIERAVL